MEEYVSTCITTSGHIMKKNVWPFVDGFVNDKSIFKGSG